MTIPHDPLHRWWVDVSDANPTEVDRLRPSLVAFLAFGPNREPALAGTGFVIAANPEMALVISAKHVFVEGVMRVQTPVPRHAPSSLFVARSAVQPSLNPEKLKAILLNTDGGTMLNTHLVDYNDSLDTTCALLMPQPGEKIALSTPAIPLDAMLPALGQVVHMVSLGEMRVIKSATPQDASGRGQGLIIYRRVCIRVGVVTGGYPNGLRHYRWPCFTTSIPAEPGMSGGYVNIPIPGRTVAACGIVCADNSEPEARTNFSKCGESIIACAWPSLCHRLPMIVPSSPLTPHLSLYEMMGAGNIPPAIGGIDKISYKDLGNGESLIGRI